MKRCLNERALLRVHTHEGTAAEREHLQLCADCAEHYDKFVEDLGAIHQILDVQAVPSRAVVRARVIRFPVRWVPFAAAAVALFAVATSLTWLRQPAPMQVATHTANVSAFAADVSAALFSDDATTTDMQLAANDGVYLQAALNAGRPCTRDGYYSGECDDHLSALLFESE